jgi:transposase-like protein
MSEKMHRAIDTAVMNNTSLREAARPLGMTGPERLRLHKRFRSRASSGRYSISAGSCGSFS